MKKLFFIAALTLISAFTVAVAAKPHRTMRVDVQQNLTMDSVSDQIVDSAETTVTTAAAGNGATTFVVVSGNDTIISIDSGTEDSGVESDEFVTIPKLKIHAPDFDFANRPVVVNDSVDSKVIAFAIFFPCATLVAILICVLIFLLIRNYMRNKVISKAIANNYQLPESFYTGSSQKVQVERTVYVKENPETGEPEEPTDEQSEDLPPLPPQPPVYHRVPTFEEKKEFRRNIVTMGIGVMIFLFFVWARSLGVGFLAGGIPFVLGLSRFLTNYYYNKDK